mgnify:CR=1 FL=1
MAKLSDSSSLTKKVLGKLWLGMDQENKPIVLPKSKTERLALQAKLANVEAEKSIVKAYQIELTRTKAVGEAMFKSGKALRISLVSALRQIFLRTEAIRREYEPGYRKTS